MRGRSLLCTGIVILVTLLVGLYLGERMGEQIGRLRLAAELGPRMAENDCMISVLSERLERLTEQTAAVLMLASWYGPGFHGQPTASGEIYDQYGMTAAHKTLPLGTVLIVENPINGRAVVVRITDRGPYVGGRELDLSYACALRLGIVDPGVVELRVRVVG